MKTILSVAAFLLFIQFCLGGTPPQILYTYSRYLTPGSVMVYAGIRPNGSPFNAWCSGIVWLPASSIDVHSASQSYPGDTGVVEISQVLTGIPTDTAHPYCYWVNVETDTIVSGESQYANSGDSLATPKIITLKPQNEGLCTVKVSALCNAHGSPTNFYFIWTTMEGAYNGRSTDSVFVSSSVDTLITASFTDLIPAAKYYFMALGNNAANSSVVGKGEYDSLYTIADSNARGIIVPLNVMTSRAIVWTALNFGVHTYATNCIDVALGEYELPPYAPGFDERFVNVHPALAYCNGLGAYTDLRPFISPAQIDTYRVRVTADPEHYPITYFWQNLDSLYSGPVKLRAGTDTIDMRAVSSYTITDADVSNLTIVATGPQPPPRMPNIILNRTVYLDTSAVQLNAIINPNGLPTSVWFEWGLTTAYGSQTAPQQIDPAFGIAHIASRLEQLFDKTLYHFRVNTENSSGTYHGADGIFLVSNATSVNPGPPALPARFALMQNFPNPFNPSTAINYSIPVRTHVRLDVMNVLGEIVRVLIDENKQAGSYSVPVDMTAMPSGIYFYRLQSGKFFDVKKMVLVR